MESAASHSRRGMNRAFLRSGALGLALIAPSGAVAMTQTSAGAQVQLAAGNDSKTVKEVRREGRAANDWAGDSGVLKREQNTATLGLIWWFGKEGSW
jgi:hypothetical protein